MKKSRTPIVFGVGTAVLLILVFITFAAFGLHTNPIFSLFNGVVMAAGMFLSINAYKKEKGKNFEYFKGFVATFLTGFNATLIFTLFFVFYASAVEPTYIATMIGNWSTHYNTPEGLVVFVVFVMGMCTTMVLTLTYMQFFKETWNTTKAKTMQGVASLG